MRIKPNAKKRKNTNKKQWRDYLPVISHTAAALYWVTDRIDRAYNLFWSNLKHKKKCSPPKFKKVRKYKSYTLKQARWKLDEANGKIRIGKKWYGYFKSRNIEGRINTVTIKRDNVR